MDLPTLEQLHSIEPVLTRIVSADDLDRNGHMNAAHFFVAQIGATRAALASAGFTDDYVSERRMGTFVAEHHLRYLSELRRHDEYSIRTRFLGRTGKVIHAAGFLVNESANRLAHVLEAITVHVDQETRRATEIPSDIAKKLDAIIASGDALGWSMQPRLALRRG